MATATNFITKPATKTQAGWRKLPLDALEAAILAEWRRAVRERLSERDWKQLDRMRGRVAALRKE